MVSKAGTSRSLATELIDNVSQLVNQLEVQESVGVYYHSLNTDNITHKSNI